MMSRGLRCGAGCAAFVLVAGLIAGPASAQTANTIAELVALARAEPGKVAYGSGGSGSASHLGVELLQLEAGFRMLHVPYKGSTPEAFAARIQKEIPVWRKVVEAAGIKVD